MRRTGPIATLAAMLVLAGCGDSGSSGSRDDRASGAGRTPTATASAAGEAPATRDDVVEGLGGAGGFDPRSIYARESPGVVTVISVFGGGSIAGGDSSGSGLGSGFVLDRQGEIVTNTHVVTSGEGAALEEAHEVYVDFADGNRVAARVRGYDPNADVALLRIDPTGLALDPLPLGDSERVRVGEPVAAMGSPFGEEQSLSVGVVSAIDRDIESLTDFSIAGAIQTDAAINPGNSGGPLVDAHGRVIGLNQQIKSQSGGGEGVGFALPINLAKRSIAQLRDKGRTDYAYIGVRTAGVYPQLADRFHLPVRRGVWVQESTPGGPARDAGIRGGGSSTTRFQASSYATGGDVIVAVDGQPVDDPADLSEVVVGHDPGDRVDVVLYRGGRKQTVRVTLGRRPVTVGSPPGR